MKFKNPKKFKNFIKFSVVAVFVVCISLTSKVETVHSQTPELNDDITQKVIPYDTYEEVNANLDFMERKVVQEGIDGLVVEYNGVEVVVQKPQSEVIQVGEKFIETFTGSMTGYGPDCKGCGGKVGYGLNVTNGNIYYEDAKYGKLRIIAADKKYPYGTVMRISNSNVLKEPTLAIVLDRGGAVKGSKIDLLFDSEKNIPRGTSQKGITIDVVRLGF